MKLFRWKGLGARITLNQLTNFLIVICLTVAATNLYWFIQYRNTLSNARCDFEFVVNDGRLAPVSPGTAQLVGKFSGTMDGRVLLTPDTGEAADVTACVAGKMGAAQVRVISTGKSGQ